MKIRLGTNEGHVGYYEPGDTHITDDVARVIDGFGMNGHTDVTVLVISTTPAGHQRVCSYTEAST